MRNLNIDRRPLVLLEMDFGSRSAERMASLDPQDRDARRKANATYFRSGDTGEYSKVVSRLTEARDHFFNKLIGGLSRSFGEDVFHQNSSTFGRQVLSYHEKANQVNKYLDKNEDDLDHLSQEERDHITQDQSELRSLLRGLASGDTNYKVFFDRLHVMKNGMEANRSAHTNYLNKVFRGLYELSFLFLTFLLDYANGYSVYESIVVLTKPLGAGYDVGLVSKRYKEALPQLKERHHRFVDRNTPTSVYLTFVTDAKEESGVDIDSLFRGSLISSGNYYEVDKHRNNYMFGGDSSDVESSIKENFKKYAPKVEKALGVFLASASGF